MNEPYVTIKIWVKTKRLLKMISALTDENMVEVLHRLLTEEWRRLNKNEQAADVASYGEK